MRRCIIKIEDYDWRKLPPDLVEWLGDVTELLNLGKYAFNAGAVPPTSATPAQTGENTFVKDGATWYLYIYTGVTDGWKKAALSSL